MEQRESGRWIHSAGVAAPRPSRNGGVPEVKDSRGTPPWAGAETLRGRETERAGAAHRSVPRCQGRPLLPYPGGAARHRQGCGRPPGLGPPVAALPRGEDETGTPPFPCSKGGCGSVPRPCSTSGGRPVNCCPPHRFPRPTWRGGYGLRPADTAIEPGCFTANGSRFSRPLRLQRQRAVPRWLSPGRPRDAAGESRLRFGRAVAR